jgi:hypothetical protein
VIGWIAAAVSGLVGVTLAIVAAWGVITSSTSAPSHNPASSQIIDYGQR